MKKKLERPRFSIQIFRNFGQVKITLLETQKYLFSYSDTNLNTRLITFKCSHCKLDSMCPPLVAYNFTHLDTIIGTFKLIVGNETFQFLDFK